MLLVVLSCLVLLVSAGENDLDVVNGEQLFVFMVDGFRWDYVSLQPGQLPALEALIQDGVKAEWVEPIFPVLSYPSWTTISTGVFPETHGIMGNYFRDMERRLPFDLFDSNTTKLQQWWQAVDPIWITATEHNRRSALFKWSRCDVPVRGIQPEICNGFETRKGKGPVREVLQKSIERLNDGFPLVMAYAEHVDNNGHQYGPNSKETMQAVRDVDDALKEFLDQLIDSGLDHKVNIILVADHGMTYVGEGSGIQLVKLEKYLNLGYVDYILDSSGFVSIAPTAGKKKNVYDQLKNVRGIQVYMKEDIPERYNYKHNKFTHEVIVVPEEGYVIQSVNSPKQIPPYRSTISNGIHGYDPSLEDMRPFFIASGPDFKKGHVHPPIRLVDIYQLYPYLLGIPPQPNNGSWERVSGMLINDTSNKEPSAVLLIMLCVLFYTVTTYST